MPELWTQGCTHLPESAVRAPWWWSSWAGWRIRRRPPHWGLPGWSGRPDSGGETRRRDKSRARGAEAAHHCLHSALPSLSSRLAPSLRRAGPGLSVGPWRERRVVRAKEQHGLWLDELAAGSPRSACEFRSRRGFYQRPFSCTGSSQPHAATPPMTPTPMPKPLAP